MACRKNHKVDEIRQILTRIKNNNNTHTHTHTKRKKEKKGCFPRRIWKEGSDFVLVVVVVVGGGVEELRMLVLGLNVRNVTFATTQLPPSYFLVKVRCCDKKPFEKYWRLFSQGYGR